VKVRSGAAINVDEVDRAGNLIIINFVRRHLEL
jgi:hypothetical protein